MLSSLFINLNIEPSHKVLSDEPAEDSLYVASSFPTYEAHAEE